MTTDTSTLDPLATDPRISEAQLIKMRRASERLGYVPDWYWSVSQVTPAGLAQIKGLRFEGPAFDEDAAVDRLPPGSYRAKLWAKNSGMIFVGDPFTVSDTMPRTPGEAPAPAAPPPAAPGVVITAEELARQREAMEALRKEVAEHRRGGVGLTLGDLSALIASLGTAATALIPLFKRETIGIKDILPLVNKSSVTEAIEGLAQLQRLQGDSGGGGGGESETALLTAFAPLLAKLMEGKPAAPPRPQPIRREPVPTDPRTVPLNGHARPQIAPKPNPPTNIAAAAPAASGQAQTAHAESPAPAVPDIDPIVAAVLFAASNELTAEEIAPALFGLYTKAHNRDPDAAANALGQADAATLTTEWRSRTGGGYLAACAELTDAAAAALVEYAIDVQMDMDDPDDAEGDDDQDEPGRPGIDIPGEIDDDGNPRAGNPATAPKR